MLKVIDGGRSDEFSKSKRSKYPGGFLVRENLVQRIVNFSTQRGLDIEIGRVQYRKHVTYKCRMDEGTFDLEFYYDPMKGCCVMDYCSDRILSSSSMSVNFSDSEMGYSIFEFLVENYSRYYEWETMKKDMFYVINPALKRRGES